jgi:hypothetical protein
VILVQEGRMRQGTAFLQPGGINAPFQADCRQVAAEKAVSQAGCRTNGEQKILAMLNRLKAIKGGLSVYQRYHSAVLQLFRFVQDGPDHGKTGSVLKRRQCHKCSTGDKNSTHYAFCDKPRLFKSEVEKSVFKEVRSAITAFQNAHARWRVPSTPTIHGDKTLDELNSEREDADTFLLARGEDPSGRMDQTCRIAADAGSAAAPCNSLQPPPPPAPTGCAGRAAQGPPALPLHAVPPPPPPPLTGAGGVTTSETLVENRDHELEQGLRDITMQVATNNLLLAWRATIIDGIQRGRQNARQRHTADKTDFVNFTSLYPNSVNVAASRELPHMRKMVSERMKGIPVHGSPYMDGVLVQQRTPTPLVEWRAIQGNRVRTRPDLYNYVTHGLHVLVVNWATCYNMQLLSDAGFSALPCGNPQCSGHEGHWDTKPLRWQHNITPPSVYIDSLGRPHPVDAMQQHCNTCGANYLHTSPVLLDRLLHMQCFDLLNQLPWDPAWTYADNVFVDSSVSADFKTDCVTRQGAGNLVSKAEIRAAEHIDKKHMEYVRHGALWWRALTKLVGDEAWEHIPDHLKPGHAELRGEFQYFKDEADKIAPWTEADVSPQRQFPCQEDGGQVEGQATSQPMQNTPGGAVSCPFVLYSCLL